MVVLVHWSMYCSSSYRLDVEASVFLQCEWCCSRQIMARLGIEPRLPEYIPGALPTELPSLRYQTGLPLYVTTLCEQIAHPTIGLFLHFLIGLEFVCHCSFH